MIESIHFRGNEIFIWYYDVKFSNSSLTSTRNYYTNEPFFTKTLDICFKGMWWVLPWRNTIFPQTELLLTSLAFSIHIRNYPASCHVLWARQIISPCVQCMWYANNYSRARFLAKAFYALIFSCENGMIDKSNVSIKNSRIDWAVNKI